jgi:hypothetical protein
MARGAWPAANHADHCLLGVSNISNMIIKSKATGFWIALFCIAAVMLFAGLFLTFSGHVGWGTGLIVLSASLSLGVAQKLGHLKL